MRQVDVEAWADRLIRQAEESHHVEDNRSELKAVWPEARGIARQLGGHANAAGGEPILWLLGVDEHVGVVTYQSRDMATWHAQLSAEFEGFAPNLKHFSLSWQEQPFEALVFFTDAPPYVVRNPKRSKPGESQHDLDVPWRDLEVPWREGGTRSARRADLITMLRPIGRAPSFDAEGTRIQLVTRDRGAALVSAFLYVSSPVGERLLIPSASVTVDFGTETSDSTPLLLMPVGTEDPDVIRSRSHLSIHGGGKIGVTARPSVPRMPAEVTHPVVLRMRFRVASIPQPVAVDIVVPTVPNDGSTTDCIGQWGFGIQ